MLLRNNKYAINKVIRILKNCAPRKAYKGFRLLVLSKSEKFVSSPILVNASANHNPCKFFKPSFTSPIAAALIKKENNKEAPMKPSTNFGKRSHITLKVGLLSWLYSLSFLYNQPNHNNIH